MVKRIISCFLSICIIFVSFCSAAFADSEYSSSAVTYWEMLLHDAALAGSSLNGWIPGISSLQGVASYLDGDICSQSSDGYHHCSSVSNFRQDAGGGYYCQGVCSDCGQTFIVRGDDAERAYNDYVSDNGKEGSIEYADGSTAFYVPCFQVNRNSSGAMYILSNGTSYPASSTNYLLTYSYSNHFGVFSFTCSSTGDYWSRGPFEYRYDLSDLPSNFFISGYDPPTNYSVTSDASFNSNYSVSNNTTNSIKVFYAGESSNCNYISFRIPDLVVHGTFTDSSPINIYNTNNNVITVDNTDYTVTSYNYDNRTYETNTGYSITFGDEQYTIIDNSGNTTNYYYYITNNNGDNDPGTGTGEGGESGGDGTGCNCTDYTSIINSIAAKIDTLLTKIQNIDNDTNDIDLIINSLDTTSENSYLLLQLIYSSLQLVQTDVNTTKDTVNSILTVARTCAENGTITNTKLEDVKTKLDTLIAQGNVTNANLVTIIQGLYDSEQVSWLQRIYQAILSLGSDTDPIEVGEEPEDEEEELDTWDFIRLLKERMEWIFDLQDVFEQLVADVSSDASSAQMVHSGEITRGDLTSDHAAAPLSTNNNMSRSAYTAPELMLSLGSSNKYGVDWGSMSIIDLSWYSEYKDQVDDILSGFLWLAYVWLLIRRAPSIINGGAMVADNVYKIENF